MEKNKNLSFVKLIILHKCHITSIHDCYYSRFGITVNSSRSTLIRNTFCNFTKVDQKVRSFESNEKAIKLFEWTTATTVDEAYGGTLFLQLINHFNASLFGAFL